MRLGFGEFVNSFVTNAAQDDVVLAKDEAFEKMKAQTRGFVVPQGMRMEKLLK